MEQHVTKTTAGQARRLRPVTKITRQLETLDFEHETTRPFLPTFNFHLSTLN
jgi:hypothetical protein